MKKLTSPVQKVNAQVIGLDVHKNLIVYCVLDRAGREIAADKVGGDRGSLEALLKKLVGRKKTHFTFEASGHSMWVYDLLAERYGKERVHVAQSKKIRAIANSQEKNDANDAFWLAYLTYEGRLPESYVPTLVYRELRIATRERILSVRHRTEVYQRVRAHLAQLGRPVSSTTLSALAAQRAVRLIAEEIGGERAHALLTGLDEIDRMSQVIATWDERVKSIAAELPEVAAIEQHMPGAGAVLSATIVAEAGPIDRFGTAKAFARYTGLTPSERSSGGRTQYGGISREGNANLRWALTHMAMSCMRSKHGAGLAAGEWIRRKQKRMGCKGKARCAAARKLAESIWRLFVYGECFDAARPFGATS